MALDEFDQLRDVTDIIYDLQLLRDKADQALGLILVSKQGPSTLQLESLSESRLSCQTLGFHPYTTPELVEILEERAPGAFALTSWQGGRSN